MVHTDEVKRQLVEIGAANLMWGRAEIRELPRVLFEGECLNHVLNGRYEGGFALLCATDQRVILIDKKPFYLTLEDTRYEMISDVQFNHRLIDASICIGTVHKRLTFRAYHHNKLRDLSNFIQQKAMDSRQQWQQAPAAPMVVVSSPPQIQPNPSLSALPQAAAGADSSLPVDPVKGILAATQTQNRPPINPYKMPIMIRHRVSRFY